MLALINAIKVVRAIYFRNHRQMLEFRSFNTGLTGVNTNSHKVQGNSGKYREMRIN